MEKNQDHSYFKKTQRQPVCQVVICNEWNEGFFKDFIQLQKKVHKHNAYAIYEKLDDYFQLYSSHTPFSKQHYWKFGLLKVDEMIVARLGCTLSKTQSSFLSIGYYESLPHTPINGLKLLFLEIESLAQNRSISEIRFPMQGGFFGSYRATLEFKSPPYYGEPQTLPRYHQEWKNLGLVPDRKWNSYEINVRNMSKVTQSVLQKFYKTSLIPNLAFEQIGQNDLKKDLNRLRLLFKSCYGHFEEYNDISEKDFFELYSQYGFLFKNYYCYIVTYKSNDIGFSICYPDILPALLWAQKLYLPSILTKLLLFLYLKLCKPRFMFPYLGKTPQSEDLKGFSAAAFEHTANQFPKYIQTISFHYIAEGSPSLKMFDPNSWRAKSQYIIYRKSLERSTANS